MTPETYLVKEKTVSKWCKLRAYTRMLPQRVVAEARLSITFKVASVCA